MIQKGCHSVKIALLKVRWTVDSDMLGRALIPPRILHCLIFSEQIKEYLR